MLLSTLQAKLIALVQCSILQYILSTLCRDFLAIAGSPGLIPACMHSVAWLVGATLVHECIATASHQHVHQILCSSLLALQKPGPSCAVVWYCHSAALCSAASRTDRQGLLATPDGRSCILRHCNVVQVLLAMLVLDHQLGLRMACSTE